MSRRGFTDVFVEDDLVKIVIDIRGIEAKDLYLGISTKGNSLIVKYVKTNVVLEIPIPVTVTDQFDWFVNNGVLAVEIKR